ncbi:Uma2 family endonuclease [Fibrella forsythiae]|uniref:Uma2 family endonuclease n=1 Tax=Fibrella forsythiae TaxID=2817061 RepID=A0ABS3JRU8_9BACT|nr:Uma2 family endonuclease [Fibrella forsythiae]MBO0952703.1 Uma2 family endonuclease [Fibrella forsythiae]
METVRVHFPEDLRMNDDKLFRFCRDNPGLRFERRKNGDIIFMSLTGGETGNQNFELSIDFGIWNRQSKWGYFFDSSTAFRLSDTSVISPDVAGVSKSRWEALTEKERRRFVPLCPDFVLELLSPSDRLVDAQQKMEDWMANGCQLGWLLSPATSTAYIYRSNQEVVVYETTHPLSGEDILPDFMLDLSQL